MLAKASSRFRVTARRDRIRLLAHERLGARTDAAISRAINLDQVSLCRILNGSRQPSGPVIALFVTSLEAPFDELFAIEHVTPKAA